MTTVGQRIREIRKQRNLTQRQLADRVGINFTYLSRVENDRLDDEQTPREETLQKIASALKTDADELLLLARRIPGTIRDRILDKPGIFRRILKLSDSDLEDILEQLECDRSPASATDPLSATDPPASVDSPASADSLANADPPANADSVPSGDPASLASAAVSRNTLSSAPLSDVAALTSRKAK